MTAVQSPYVLTPQNIAEEVDFRDSPFRYFLAKRCLAPDIEQDLLGWFETDAPWSLVETDFYEQYEFSMLHVALPKTLHRLVSPNHLLEIRSAMAAIFNKSFSDRIALLAHKLTPGQRIGIHNDYLEGHETHRLTIQLNRGLDHEDGGLFMLFNSSNPKDIHRILRPICGTGLGFEISYNSNHAVSRLHGGERYTLVYSFYATHVAEQHTGPI